MKKIYSLPIADSARFFSYLIFSKALVKAVNNFAVNRASTDEAE